MLKLSTILFFISLLCLAGCGVYIDTTNMQYQQENIVLTDIDTLWLRSNRGIRIDSVVGSHLPPTQVKSTQFAYPLNQLNGGLYDVEWNVYLANGKHKQVSQSFKVLSSIQVKHLVPEHLNFVKHDESIFTQGLIVFKDKLYESGGLYGKSTLNRIDPQSGAVEQSVLLDDKLFAEGLCCLNDSIWLITWKEKQILSIDTSLNIIAQKSYPYEGWGLCNNDSSLIASDGSSKLYFLHPETLVLQKAITVYDEQRIVRYLNELEWINGHIWANVLGQEYVLQIDPNTGRVVTRIDFSEVIQDKRLNKYGSFNGIAYNARTNTVYFTGKNWPNYLVWKLPEELK